MNKNRLYHPNVIIVCNLENLNIRENLRENEVYLLYEQALRSKEAEDGVIKYWVGTYWSGFASKELLTATEESENFVDFADALKSMNWIWKGELEYVRPDFQEILWEELQKRKINSDEVTKRELEQIEHNWAEICNKLN